MRAAISRRMAGKARVLAVLLLLAFARLATADSSSQIGDDLPPMNPPVILNDDPNTPITYEWPFEGAWPLSDDDEALAKAYAADEAAYVLDDYAEGVVLFTTEPEGEAGPCAGCCCMKEAAWGPEKHSTLAAAPLGTCLVASPVWLPAVHSPACKACM